MYDVKGNLHEVLGSLPAGVSLVAISKFHPNEFIEAAYAEGSASLARAMSRNSPRRWLPCLRISSGISSVICRLTR